MIRVSDLRWVFIDESDGATTAYVVRAATPDEPDALKWPKIVACIYAEEAKRVCDAHNGVWLEDES